MSFSWRRPSAAPLWRDEFRVDTADERYVARRQFAKFLALTSLGMLAGNAWILLRSRFGPRPPALPRAVVAEARGLPVGGARVFAYPTPGDPCLLVRRGADEYVAFSQKCTHLSCAVYYARERDRLECPCHEGKFSVKDGRVLGGPPPRPLPRVILERQGDEVVAVGIDLGEKG